MRRRSAGRCRRTRSLRMMRRKSVFLSLSVFGGGKEGGREERREDG